jgi:hypothetical protein
LGGLTHKAGRRGEAHYPEKVPAREGIFELHGRQ